MPVNINLTDMSVRSDNGIANPVLLGYTSDLDDVAAAIESKAAETISEYPVRDDFDNMVAAAFSTTTSYAIDDYCRYPSGDDPEDVKLYRFINTHYGAWNTSDVEEVTVGEELGELKSDLNAFSEISDFSNLFWFTEKENVTKSGITYYFNDSTQTITASGTNSSSDATMHFFWSNSSSLPTYFKSGKSYKITNTWAQPPYLGYNLKVDNSWVGWKLCSADPSFLYIPEDTNSLYFALRTYANTSVNLSTSYPIIELFSDDEEKLFSNFYKTSTSTTNGITITYITDKKQYYISGTATATSYYQLYKNFLPNNLQAGDTIAITSSFSMSDHVRIKINFYSDLALSTQISGNLMSNAPNIITIPEGTVGIGIFYYWYSGYTLDDYMDPPVIKKINDNTLIQNPYIHNHSRKIVSFIDDDTASDTYVTRYHDACMHNGILGSYAVITKPYIQGTNDISLLTSAQAEGFNMILHCYTQQTYLNTTSSDWDAVTARKEYAQAIIDFNTLGLINPYNCWVIPYGVCSEENLAVRDNLGFSLAFSTYYATFNKFITNDFPFVYRTGLAPTANITDDTDTTEAHTMAWIKTKIDDFVDSDCGGWLIITTHFNTWDGETWDTTLDDNGYPTGYSRFNELISYIENQDLEIVPMAVGIREYLKYNNS